MKHGLMMLIGCGGTLVLLFLLPALGVSLGVTFVVAIALMLACHLFMGHGMTHEHNSPGERKHEESGHEHH